jgi:Family of unknown function (DUF6101)
LRNDRGTNPGGETKAVRRQTATGGINPAAGSGRAMRLDPLSLPISFHAHDARADGCVRQVELHRERVVLHRAVRGMQMSVKLRVSDFLGVALRSVEDGEMLVLAHRDPSLNVPLCVTTDADELATAWQMWSDVFALPMLEDSSREPAQRRRRRNVIRTRRPKFLLRRRIGSLLDKAKNYRGEREIIARS